MDVREHGLAVACLLVHNRGKACERESFLNSIKEEFKRGRVHRRVAHRSAHRSAEFVPHNHNDFDAEVGDSVPARIERKEKENQEEWEGKVSNVATRALRGRQCIPTASLSHATPTHSSEPRLPTSRQFPATRIVKISPRP